MTKIRRLITVSLVSVLSAGFCASSFAQDWQSKYDGVEYVYFENEIHAVRIDTNYLGVSIFPTISQAHEPMPTKEWCEKHNLEVGVNANFYSMSNSQDPSGMAIYQGVNWGKKNTNQHAQIAFTKDNRVRIYPAVNTDQPDWMYYAVAGEPEIIKDGKVIDGINSTGACKSLGHCENQRSRTGACLDKDGRHLILTTTKGDGASGGGITVVKFAEYMVKLGCDYGVNLDGGGSAQIYLAGKKYGTNSSRTVATSLGFNVIDTPAYFCKVAEIDNPGTVFYDMAADHWAAEAAEALKSHGITLGCGGDEGRPLFCPSCGTKRIQAALFVFGALGLEDLTPETPTFEDIAASNEHYGKLEALVAKGVVSKADKYRPEDVMTRAEAATIIAKAFVDDVDGYAKAPTPTFSDVSSDKWYYAPIEALARNCIVSGTDGKFNPENPISRAEFASMLASAAGYVKGTCIFEKKCEKIGEGKCDGDKLNLCVAYEFVSADCEDGKKCISGVCAECSADDAPSCSDNMRKYCDNGTWNTEDCAADSRICSDGQCKVKDKEPECDSTFEPVCDDKNLSRVKYCDNGVFAYEVCNTDASCKDGKCVDGEWSGGDNPIEPDVPDNPNGSDKKQAGIDVHSSSCSMSSTQNHSVFWLLMALFGGLGVLKRRGSMSI